MKRKKKLRTRLQPPSLRPRNGKKHIGPLPAELKLAAQQEVLQLYAKGRTNEQIADELCFSKTQVTRYLTEALDSMVRMYAKASPQHTFIRYAAFQMSVIKKLGDAYDDIVANPRGRQYTAAVASLKAQSDIFDKIMDKGVEFGVITTEKADKSLRYTPHDIQIALREEITVLAKLLDEVDTHTEFKKRRARVITVRRMHLARVRKVKRNALGWVRAVPDWKYKTVVLDSVGKPVPKDAIDPVQRQTVIDVGAQQAEDLKWNRLQAEYEKAKKEREANPPRPKAPVVIGAGTAIRSAKRLIEST